MSITARIEDTEARSSCCILECDGPGYLDAKVINTPGLRIVVVRFFAVHIRAAELGGIPISSFNEAVEARSWSIGGVAVVADRAFKYLAAMIKQPVALLVFEAYESLCLPNCSFIETELVWLVKCSNFVRHHHRGFASQCYNKAQQQQAIVQITRSNRSYPTQERSLFYDVRTRECDAVLQAIEAEDTETAVAAFPGFFEGQARENTGTGECPICYETPSPRITTRCCNRDFCLKCFAKSINDDVSSCPWCRGVTGMFNCSIESGHDRAPAKDMVVMTIIGNMLTSGERILVVTTDDSYLIMNSNLNPVRPYIPVLLSGGSKTMDRAMRDFKTTARVAVAHATHMLCGGLNLPATAILFTERAAWEDPAKKRCWMSTCKDLRRVVCMVSVVDAPSFYVFS